MTTNVLAVCTGNICRSPAVERLLAAGLEGSDVHVSSAGTGALVGEPISGPMATLVAAAGADADDFAARRLTADLLRESQVILALTRAHRAEIVELFPGAVRRTFTLRELARLGASAGADRLPAGTPGERLTALLNVAARQRSVVGPAGDDDDVIDPYRQGDAVYQQSFDELRAPIETLLALIRG